MDARVLPAGRFRLSYTYGVASGISEGYQSDSSKKSLTSDYNIELNSDTLKTFDPQISELITYLNSFDGYRYDSDQKNGLLGGIVLSNDESLPTLGDAIALGFTNVDATASQKKHLLTFQYGLSNKVSVGFQIPYIKSNVSVKYGISGNNNASELLDAWKSVDPGELSSVINGLNQLSSLSTDTFQELLSDAGYSNFGDFSETGLGDVVLGGRYNYLNLTNTQSGDWINSFQGGFTAPTGKVYDPSEITAIDFGQGVWDFGAAHLLNYTPTPWFTFQHSLNYTYRFEGELLDRVRENESDIIPDASTEEMLNAKLGDKYWTAIGLKLDVTSFFSITSSYEWYWKDSDHYSGSRDKDYTHLSGDTHKYLETLQIGASFSSIKAFQDYKFPLPGDFSVNYYKPVTGKNSVIAPFVVAELALYF